MIYQKYEEEAMRLEDFCFQVIGVMKQEGLEKNS